MKHLIYITIAALLFGSLSFAGDHEGNPKPPGDDTSRVLEAR